MDSQADKRLDIGLENTVLLKLMLPTVNTDGGIGSDVCVKAKRPETLTAVQGLFLLDWG